VCTACKCNELLVTACLLRHIVNKCWCMYLLCLNWRTELDWQRHGSFSIYMLVFFRQPRRDRTRAVEDSKNRSSNNTHPAWMEWKRKLQGQPTRGPTFATAAPFVHRGPRQGGAELLGISNGGPGTRLRVGVAIETAACGLPSVDRKFMRRALAETPFITQRSSRVLSSRVPESTPDILCDEMPTA
jgi:hypothetical protein